MKTSAPGRDTPATIEELRSQLAQVTRERDELRREQGALLGFLRSNPFVAWIKDEQGHYLFASEAYERQCGFSAGQWQGRTDFDLWPEEFAAACRKLELQVLESGELTKTEGFAPGSDQTQHEWRIRRFPIEADGKRYIAGVATDMTERRRLERSLAQSEERLGALVDHSPVVMWIKDQGGRYTYLNRSYETRFAVSLDQYRGRTDRDFWPVERAERYHATDMEVLASGKVIEDVEIVPDPDGIEHFWWVMKFPIDYDSKRVIGGCAIDITERKRAEEEVRLQSLTDHLTGLYNRRGLLLMAEQEYPLIRRHQYTCALFFIDLDGLKSINDRHGHDSGDEALMVTSEQLRCSFRVGDLISRVGGDEFAVLATNCGDPEVLVQRLMGNIEQMNESAALPFRLSLSVGWTPFKPGIDKALAHFLAEADARMYEEKRGKLPPNP